MQCRTQEEYSEAIVIEGQQISSGMYENKFRFHQKNASENEFLVIQVESLFGMKAK